MRNKLNALFAILYYLNWYPFFITSFVTSGSFVLGVLWGLLWYTTIPSLKKKPVPSYTRCTILIALLFIIRIIFYQETESFSYLLFTIASWFGLYFLINSFDLNHVIYNIFRFKYIMIFCSIIGMVLYTLHYLPVIASWSYSSSGMSDATYSINSYGLFNVKISNFSDLIFVRSSGWYDEPGSFSFVIALLLAFNYLYLKKDKVTNILIFGGLVTLSAAHVVISAYYYVFNKFSIKRLISISFMALIIIILQSTLSRNGVAGYVRQFTFDRFESVMEGNDRSRNFNVTLEAAKEYWLTGCNFQVLLSKDEISKDSLYFQIAQFGIWGILIYYCFIIYGILKIRNKNDALFIAALFGMLFFQRPVYIMPPYLVLIYFLFFERVDTKCLVKL